MAIASTYSLATTGEFNRRENRSDQQSTQAHVLNRSTWSAEVGLWLFSGLPVLARKVRCCGEAVVKADDGFVGQVPIAALLADVRMHRHRKYWPMRSATSRLITLRLAAMRGVFLEQGS